MTKRSCSRFASSRYITFALLLVFGLRGVVVGQGAVVETDFDRAQYRAAQEGKPLMVLMQEHRCSSRL